VELKIALCTGVLLLFALHHYLFSFQRFTLLIARKNAGADGSVTDIQAVLSPTLLGAVGWLTTLVSVAMAVVLGWTFRWWLGILYLLLDSVALGMLPLLPLKSHFAKLARNALDHQPYVASQLRARLTIDVIRAGAGHSI
jgi:hypothetical protein